MKTKLRYFIPLVFVLISIGCEPELVTKIPLPTEEQKLIVTAFLTPGSAKHSVSLSASIPNNFNFHENPLDTPIVVMISDGTTSVKLFQDDEGYLSFYDYELPVIMGKQYFLEASVNGIPKSISASTRIPLDFDPQFEVIKIDTTGTTEEETKLGFVARFRDVPGTKDFYRITAHATWLRDYPGYTDTVIWEMNSLNSQPQLIKDEGKDGGWFQYNFSLSLYSDAKSRLTSVETIIYRVDEDYYKFHYPFVVSGYYNDNPFGEPIIVHSNVKNGYGIFTGVVEKRYVTQLP